MKKDLLRAKLVDFQKRIMTLSQELRQNDKERQDSENRFALEIVAVLDSFENVLDNVQGKEESFDKAAKRAVKSFRAIYRKLIRVLEERGVEKIEFADGKAKIGLCQVVETRVEQGREQGSILAVVRNGYQRGDRVLRLAEVITVGDTDGVSDGDS